MPCLWQRIGARIKMNFLDYFKHSIDYTVDMVSGPIACGVLNRFVSSSFLNGFINYVTPVKAFVVSHYYRWDEPMDHIISIQNPPGSSKWKDFKCTTKEDAYKELIIAGTTFHSLCDKHFNDDVAILTKCGKLDIRNCYLFFYYDLDSFDCSLGRFSTEDDEPLVIERFNLFIKSLSSVDKPREIPLSYFNGWISG